MLKTDTYYHANGNVNYYFYGGVPIWTPAVQRFRILQQSRGKYDMGIYAQDQWAVTNQLTLTLGLRWDYFNSYVPDQTGGFAGEQDGYWEGVPDYEPWIAPAEPRRGRQRPELEGLQPTPWSRVRPVRQRQDRRQGDARPLHGEARDRNRRDSEPVQHLESSSASRSWTDWNGNYVPIAIWATSARRAARRVQVLATTAVRSATATSVRTTRLPRHTQQGVLEGYGKRDHNWDFTTEVQHELIQGLALTRAGITTRAATIRYAFGQPVQQQGTGDRQHPRGARGLRRVLRHRPLRFRSCRAAAAIGSAVFTT